MQPNPKFRLHAKNSRSRVRYYAQLGLSVVDSRKGLGAPRGPGRAGMPPVTSSSPSTSGHGPEAVRGESSDRGEDDPRDRTLSLTSLTLSERDRALSLADREAGAPVTGGPSLRGVPTVSIIGSDTRVSHSDQSPYTVYMICVAMGLRTWIVERR